MERCSVAAILLAAGRGERAGASIEGPKQYRRLDGQTVLSHALSAFLAHPAVGRIVTVIHPDDGHLFRTATAQAAAGIEVAIGGSSRQASVLNGLRFLRDDPPDVVLIHDGARPFVTTGVIDRTIAMVDVGVAALPVMPVTDTLKRGSESGFVTATVDRSGLFAAQTPQGFPFQAILGAHEEAAKSVGTTFTDDASLAEWAGMTVRMVAGAAENVKLTTAQDIEEAQRRMERVRPTIDVRTGNGYDVHQLVPGDHVTLCGVRIAHDMALSGHSDADVGLHALTDALLATCGAGDIGDHFPPSDPQWKGAASRIFVSRAVEIVAGRGGRIANADITLICEAPKIAPHRDAMRSALSEMTGLELERVSVKATTNETIGFIGRREGIAAIATASVIYGDRR